MLQKVIKKILNYLKMNYKKIQIILNCSKRYLIKDT